MEKENGNVLNLSPYKIDSIERALKDLSVDTNLASTVSNTSSTATNTASAASLLSDIKGQNATVISNLGDIKTQNTTIISDLGDIKALLQQLVDK